MSRRQTAVPQAAIARAQRVAQRAGPEWCVEIEGPIVRLVRHKETRYTFEDERERLVRGATERTKK